MISIRSVGLSLFVAIGLCAAHVNVSAATATPAPAKKGMTPAQRYNVALQMESLAERLTRSWAMKGNDAIRTRAGNDYDEDSRRFQRQLKMLQADADTPALKEAYATLEQLATKYATAADTSVAQLRNGDLRADPNADLPPTAFLGTSANKERPKDGRATLLSGVKDISDQTDKLVLAAAKGSDLWRQKMPAEEAEPLRMAGQARTAAQRMAKLYFFRYLGVPEASIAADMKKAEASYLQGMKRVRELSEDRPKAAGIISLIDQQWMFYSEFTRRAGQVEREDRDQVFQTFSRTGDSLLSGLDDLCRSFEQPVQQ